MRLLRYLFPRWFGPPLTLVEEKRAAWSKVLPFRRES